MVIKDHHIRALKKALNILLADHADGYTESGGWCAGTQVRGWQVADECVELGFFKLSLDSKKTDLNSRRYRILPKGIEQLIKIGDPIKFRTGTFATLEAIHTTEYQFSVSYIADDKMITRWHPIGEFDLTAHTQEETAPGINNGAHIAMLTAPDLGKSPYTRVEIRGDDEARGISLEQSKAPYPHAAPESAAPVPPKQYDAECPCGQTVIAGEKCAHCGRQSGYSVTDPDGRPVYVWFDPPADATPVVGEQPIPDHIAAEYKLAKQLQERMGLPYPVVDLIAVKRAIEETYGVGAVREQPAAAPIPAPTATGDSPSPAGEGAGGEGFPRAIVEAVSGDDNSEDRIETHYFMESIATPKARTAAKLELERLLNEELYIVIHEQFIMIGDELHHVARLERESDSAAPQPIAQPVDDLLPEVIHA